ncbi:hypothetical protein U9M48_028175, partial [Paspalum notatum var. saurae]
MFDSMVFATFVLELLILKAKYGWSDSSFNDLLKLLSWLLLKPNFIPANTYQAKKVVSPLTMGVERIHAWKNEKLDKCPTCGASRYKRNDIFNGDDEGPSNDKKRKKKGIDENKRRITALVMWYLNPIDRLVFANPAFAKLMRWWYCERTKDEERLSHPADATPWQRFDELYLEYAKDPRNLRWNESFWRKEQHTQHMAVILTIYNLPTWLCQKRKYTMLCGLIQGPKQPGIDIDVFLEPLMEDMEDFTLRGMLLTMINVYPANFSLSGQIKGKKGCLVCLDATTSVYLDGSKKVMYKKYRRYLFNNHFDGKDEKASAPKRRHDSKHVFDMVRKINICYGKKIKRTKPPLKDLEVPHAIDCMHLKKNVFDSTICTLMDVKGKTKDGLKSLVYRKDLSISMYNAHDCHMMLMVFLAIAIRAINPAFVRMVVTRMKEIHKDELDLLQEFFTETMAQLEMCFPPFFDIMPHLKMWAYERFMSTLNYYVLNHAYPEGSMIEAYCTEEVVECCKDYLVDKKPNGLAASHHTG